jgi:hypothetical protein
MTKRVGEPFDDTIYVETCLVCGKKNAYRITESGRYYYNSEYVEHRINHANGFDGG